MKYTKEQKAAAMGNYQNNSNVASCNDPHTIFKDGVSHSTDDNSVYFKNEDTAMAFYERMKREHPSIEIYFEPLSMGFSAAVVSPDFPKVIHDDTQAA